MESQHRKVYLQSRHKKRMTSQRPSVGSVLLVVTLILMLSSKGQDKLVIKAQVLAGGRGKGKFDNGFQGGVHMVDRLTPFSSGLYSYSPCTAY